MQLTANEVETTRFVRAAEAHAAIVARHAASDTATAKLNNLRHTPPSSPRRVHTSFGCWNVSRSWACRPQIRSTGTSTTRPGGLKVYAYCFATITSRGHRRRRRLRQQV